MLRVIFDNRWRGDYGIGRFSSEVKQQIRLPTIDIGSNGPVSPSSLLKMELESFKYRRPHDIFFSPGFTPLITWRNPMYFTIHDLIHMDFPDERDALKNLYYKHVVRPAAKYSTSIFTVSNYSKNRIVEWSGIDDKKVVVVGNGVDEKFSPLGEHYDLGYPYILCVSNDKPHKNLDRLLEAFSIHPSKEIRLVMVCDLSDRLHNRCHSLGIIDRVIFSGKISDIKLSEYYRGASVVVVPSLYEGFGLPALEGMASGVPVVASNVTSLPEVVGNAGIMIDPYSSDSIAHGIDVALGNSDVRKRSIELGLLQAQRFSWEKVGGVVRETILGVK